MLRNIHQDSLLNAFFLSILATAGLFYVNLGGSFLSAFVDGLSIERDAAGFIVSANKYGACLLYTSPSPRDQRGSRLAAWW